MAKVIILIGPDGLGKTPLGKMMDEKEGIEYRQVQAAKDPREMTQDAILESAFLEIDKWRHDDRDVTYVYDRFPFPDDWVYQEISGKKADKIRPVYQSPPEIHRVLERRMATVGGICYLLIMPRNLKEYYETFQDIMVTREMIEAVVERYCWFYRRTIIPTVMITNHWFSYFDASIYTNQCFEAMEEK